MVLGVTLLVTPLATALLMAVPGAGVSTSSARTALASSGSNIARITAFMTVFASRVGLEEIYASRVSAGKPVYRVAEVFLWNRQPWRMADGVRQRPFDELRVTA
jgi:hypothetical protein